MGIVDASLANAIVVAIFAFLFASEDSLTLDDLFPCAPALTFFCCFHCSVCIGGCLQLSCPFFKADFATSHRDPTHNNTQG